MYGGTLKIKFPFNFLSALPLEIYHPGILYTLAAAGNSEDSAYIPPYIHDPVLPKQRPYFLLAKARLLANIYKAFSLSFPFPFTTAPIEKTVPKTALINVTPAQI